MKIVPEDQDILKDLQQVKEVKLKCILFKEIILLLSFRIYQAEYYLNGIDRSLEHGELPAALDLLSKVENCLPSYHHIKIKKIEVLSKMGRFEEVCKCFNCYQLYIHVRH